jgi:hypothetical protein
VEAAHGTALLEQQAAPALSSCPTPCQKAQSFNSCLPRHGKHQQAFLPLTTWLWRVVLLVLEEVAMEVVVEVALAGF